MGLFKKVSRDPMPNCSPSLVVSFCARLNTFLLMAASGQNRKLQQDAQSTPEAGTSLVL
jgi:hypothetical protein